MDSVITLIPTAIALSSGSNLELCRGAHPFELETPSLNIAPGISFKNSAKSSAPNDGFCNSITFSLPKTLIPDSLRTLLISKLLLTGGVISLKITFASAPQLLAKEEIFSLSQLPIFLNNLRLVHLTVPIKLTFSARTLNALPPLILPKVITTGSKGSNFRVINS